MPDSNPKCALDQDALAPLLNTDGMPSAVPTGDIATVPVGVAPDWWQCNYLGCAAPPTYALATPDETFAIPTCDQHITALLTPADTHLLRRLPQPDHAEA